MHFPLSRGIFAGTLFLATPFCFAYQPLITDDTGTQGAEGNQIEFAATGDRYKVDGATTRVSYYDAVFTRGLTDALDVFVGAGHQRIRPADPAGNASGMGNPAVGLKWRFFESESGKYSLGIKPEVALPVSAESENKGLGTGRTSWGVTGIYTRQVSFGEFHVNAAVARSRYRDTTANPDTTTTGLSAAPVWCVTEQWKVALDVGVSHDRTTDTTIRRRYVELGVVYSPNADLDVAFGVVRSADDSEPQVTGVTATGGVTWRFK